jgi:hypothetical protein
LKAAVLRDFWRQKPWGGSWVRSAFEFGSFNAISVRLTDRYDGSEQYAQSFIEKSAV